MNEYKNIAQGEPTEYPSAMLYSDDGAYTSYAEAYDLLESSRFVCISGKPVPLKVGSRPDLENYKFLKSLVYGRDVFNAKTGVTHKVTGQPFIRLLEEEAA